MSFSEDAPSLTGSLKTIYDMIIELRDSLLAEKEHDDA